MSIEPGRDVHIRTRDGINCFNARVTEGNGVNYRLCSDCEVSGLKGQKVLICQGNTETMAIVKDVKGNELFLEVPDDLYEEERRSFFRVDDAFPVKIKRVGNLSVRSSGFLFPPSDKKVDEIGTGLQDSGLVPLLQEINNKLDFLLNTLVLKEAGALNEEASAVNISASGIRFEIDEEFELGDVVELKMLLPSYPPMAVQAFGEVTRVKVLEREGRKAYDTAIEFAEMTDEVREEIIRYTLRRQREIIRKQRKDG
ncbi:MAG: PilZ domain-containing protein [Nitrospirota bacterium]|nr:PilZ domain-containing protein [Nitrospirota bacterium]